MIITKLQVAPVELVVSSRVETSQVEFGLISVNRNPSAYHTIALLWNRKHRLTSVCLLQRVNSRAPALTSTTIFFGDFG